MKIPGCGPKWALLAMIITWIAVCVTYKNTNVSPYRNPTSSWKGLFFFLWIFMMNHCYHLSKDLTPFCHFCKYFSKQENAILSLRILSFRTPFTVNFRTLALMRIPPPKEWEYWGHDALLNTHTEQCNISGTTSFIHDTIPFVTTLVVTWCQAVA